MAITREDFPLPDVEDPATAAFYAGAAVGELRVPRCAQCGEFVWYPEPACPRDGAAPAWVALSGRGTLFSWAVVQRAFLPAFADKVPFVTALAAIDEDPRVRIPTFIVDADPASLVADAVVEAVFRPLEFSTVPGKSVVVPMFRPVAT
ncbi:MAG TPA: OB-fold domain-containing protein [Acidimicrobiia bacterium]|nr:OB-fold domain-containing protein [Acidimicrobiia bacterium]